MLRRTTNAQVRGPHNIAEIAGEDQRLVHTHGLHWQTKQEDHVSLPSRNSAANTLPGPRPGHHTPSNDEMRGSLLNGDWGNDSLVPENFGLDLSAFLEGEDPLLTSGSWSSDFIYSQDG